MPTRSYQKSEINTYPKPSVIKEEFYLSYVQSPRVNGKIRLRENAFSHTLAKNLVYEHIGAFYKFGYETPTQLGAVGVNTPEAQKAYVRAEARSYARLRGKLYTGSASLGMTIASWKQSSDMIQQRSAMMSKDIRKLLKKSKLHVPGKLPKALANLYLETIFGWQPLVQDIHNAANTVIQQAELYQRVSGSAEGAFTEELYRGPSWNGRNFGGATGTVRVRQVTTARITNSNAWLAERSGLINVASVAWDAVPWSFIVGMFVNVQQVVNSITDFTGLKLEQTSVSTKCFRRGHEVRFRNNVTVEKAPWSKTAPFISSPPDVICRSEYESFTKGRTVAALATPQLQLKMPKFDSSLAAMATSLVVQQLKELEPYAKPIIDRPGRFKGTRWSLSRDHF